MKRYIARHILTAKLSVWALIAICLLHASVRAQGMIEVIVIFPSVGVTPDQKIRFTLFNPNGAPVRAQVRSHHPGGAMFVFADGSVRADAFQSFDINQSGIPVPGDERTGRKQILPSVRLTISDPEAVKPLSISMEIIDIRDGTSNTLMVAEKYARPDGGDGNDTIISGLGNDIMMGIVPGQTLLATIFNPPGATGASVTGHVKVFSGDGDLLVQSPEQVIPQGGSRSVKINRNEIPLLGEPGTTRAQVRLDPNYNPYITVDHGGSARPSPVLVSFEIVDDSTGKTVTLSGHHCLVF